MMNKGLLLVLALVSLLLVVPLTSASSHLTATATFNQSGVCGTITFSQEGPNDPTIINVMLTGLYNIAGSPSFPWHVHNYPFPNDGSPAPAPCGDAVVGGHYDPLGAILNANYTTICNQQTPGNCEVGDLSGKFGNFESGRTISAMYMDNTELSLYGIYSILGRSIVIHFENGTRFVCANIVDGIVTPNTPPVIYSPYRNDFVGNIYFRQHSRSATTAKVYTDLVRIVGSQFSSGHNWHVHDRALDVVGLDCGLAGPHYNPRNVDVSEEAGYFMRCGNSSMSMQRECEIGDLSNKGAPFNVNDRVTKQLYTDTDLPLFMSSEGFQINGLSTVIHNESLGAPRIACANISIYQPLQAISIFNENGVSGSIQFYQHSPFDPTVVTVNLRGLRSIAGGYHVHAYSVGPGSSPGRCANRYTGGHWNPHGIMQSGKTSDQFEIGDLSGKFGYLTGQNDFSGEYVDPNVPLFGPYSILGRSVVIHQSDADGTRWVCSDIQRIARIVQVTTSFSTAIFSGRVVFSQPADDPYSETTIVVEIDVQQNIPLTANAGGDVEYSWSYITGSSDCSTLSLLDVFSNSQLCSTTQQLACQVGNLSGKHGNLLIPQTAGRAFRAVFADANLPLSGRPGLESVFGGSLTGRLYLRPAAAGGDASNSVCQQSSAAVILEAPSTAGAPALSHVSAVFVLSVSLLSIVSSVLSL